jgi:hypothetical protein
MSDDKQRDETAGETIASRPMTPDQVGESGGGAYRREGEEPGHEQGNFKGGQSYQAYYGKGQLGEKQLGETENAPSAEH